MKVKIYILYINFMIFFKIIYLQIMKNYFMILKLMIFQEIKLNLKNFKNKVILLVNTASYCGFTKQYDDLANIFGINIKIIIL